MGMPMEFEHLTPLVAGGETAESESLTFHAAAGMNSKARKLKRLTLKLAKDRFYSTLRKTLALRQLRGISCHV